MKEKVVTSNEANKADDKNHVDTAVIWEEKKKEEKERNNKMTLDKNEKIFEKIRKALAASKAKERKIEADKGFEIMQMVNKK